MRRSPFFNIVSVLIFRILIFGFASYFGFRILNLKFNPQVLAQTVYTENPQSRSVSVSAAIGNRYFTLNGFTSPQSQVFLDTDTLHLQTTTKPSGYFAFSRQAISPDTREICLYSINSQNQHSAAVCIPPPPPNRYYTHIGPVLLPPTIILNSALINPNSTTIASGESIPSSTVNIHLYQTTNQAPIFPSQVSAFSLPNFSTLADEFGHFSLTIPTSYSSDYRLFATTLFQNNPSPKSNTLFYSLPRLFSFLFIFLLLIPLALIFYFLLFLRQRHSSGVTLRGSPDGVMPGNTFPVPLALPEKIEYTKP